MAEHMFLDLTGDLPTDQLPLPNASTERTGLDSCPCEVSNGIASRLFVAVFHLNSASWRTQHRSFQLVIQWKPSQTSTCTVHIISMQKKIIYHMYLVINCNSNIIIIINHIHLSRSACVLVTPGCCQGGTFLLEETAFFTAQQS